MCVFLCFVDDFVCCLTGCVYDWISIFFCVFAISRAFSIAVILIDFIDVAFSSWYV